MKNRKMIRNVMALIPALAMCIIPLCAPAENAAEPQKITFSSTGVEMELPAAFTEATGIVFPTYDFEFPDTGVYIAGLSYYAFTKEKYNELNEKEDLTDEEIEFINDRVADILWVFCIDGGREADDIREFLQGENSELPEKLPDTGEMDGRQKRELFRMIWMFTHGVATLVTAKRVNMTDKEIKKLLMKAYEGFLDTYDHGG